MADILKPLTIHIAYKPQVPFSSILGKKNFSPSILLDHIRIVYHVSCKVCSCVYIGKTGRTGCWIVLMKEAKKKNM